MSAPLRQGMWSWKHGNKCRWCGTSGKTGRNRHKGVGLCFRCFDDYRKRKPKRQQQLKNQGRKWYLEKGRTPEEKKKSSVRYHMHLCLRIECEMLGVLLEIHKKCSLYR